MKVKFGLVLIMLSLGLIRCDKDEVIECFDEFCDITDLYPYSDFEEPKTFILDIGDREIFYSMYNDNPHSSFPYFDVFLCPEIGQLNINCNAGISDFNVMVIRDWETDQQYYHVFIVRSGDIESDEILVHEGMRTNHVYLLSRSLIRFQLVGYQQHNVNN